MQMITNYAMKAGFCGGVVIDYPNSTKAKKYGSFLLLVFWVVSFDVFDGHNLHVRRPFAFTMATLMLTLFLSFLGGGSSLHRTFLCLVAGAALSMPQAKGDAMETGSVAATEANFTTASAQSRRKKGKRGDKANYKSRDWIQQKKERRRKQHGKQ